MVWNKNTQCYYLCFDQMDKVYFANVPCIYVCMCVCTRTRVCVHVCVFCLYFCVCCGQTTGDMKQTWSVRIRSSPRNQSPRLPW